MIKEGQISINTENIFPIIKKWLYSEKEIFLRELVSNAADALEKLQKISLVEEVSSVPEPKITIDINPQQKTIAITDTGLGMTTEEVERYINQVAFSGLKDFVEKYQGKDDDHQIIGHFGLGFYSSFMVADKVEIDTLSFKKDAVAAHWSCDGSTNFKLGPSERKEVGTTITLYISEDSKDLLNVSVIQGLVNKYSAFLKWPIYLDGKVQNDTNPLWTRNPAELVEKDYREFYDKLFPLSGEPLFWIHLNVDYPFKLRGVLYFPKLRHELDASQGEVKLYCNQVYVADNCKELIPEFLTLLKGVIDCHDLPLNVSRSYLQADPQVKKISEHITKKVADKLTGMAKTDRQNYEVYWADIHPFVKFGMIKDPKFYERMIEHLIFRSSTGQYTNLDEYLTRMQDKTENKIIFASDEALHAGYIAMYKDHGIEVITADRLIDKHFLPFLEMQTSRKYQFQRVDSDVSRHLIDAGAASKIIDPSDQKSISEKVTELFKNHLNRPKLKYRVEALKSDKMPAMLLMDENLRRLKELQRFGQMELPELADDDYTLVINSNSPAIKNLVQLSKSFNRDEEVKLIVSQIYDLAFLQLGRFTPESMQSFIQRSANILGRLGQSLS